MDGIRKLCRVQEVTESERKYLKLTTTTKDFLLLPHSQV